MKFTKLGLTIAAGVGFLGLVFFGGYSVGGGLSSWREDMKTLESETKNIKEAKKEIKKIVENLTQQKYKEDEVIKKLATVLDFKELNYELIQPQDKNNTKDKKDKSEQLKLTIANLQSAINDIKLSQAISAYHQKPQSDLPNNQNNMKSPYEKLKQEVSAALREDVIKKSLQPENFRKTTTSLRSIISEIGSQPPFGQDVQQLLITRLNSSIKIQSLQPVKEEEKRNLVEAIYDYQKSKQLTADGIIDNPGDTYDRLKKGI